jgi:hypothetical protein
MPPSVKGNLWPLFHREDTLVYVGATVYARCNACTAELSLAAGSDLREQRKGDEAAVAAGRAAAKLHRLVVGRDRNTHSHVLKCSRISPDAKAKSEAYWASRNATGTTNNPPGSANDSGGGRSTGPSPTFAPPPPAKRRKTGNCIAQYGAFGDRFKHNKEEH